MRSLLEYGIIRIRNKIYTNCKDALQLSVHCAGNRFSIKGQKTYVRTMGNSYLRDSSCDINGDNNCFVLGNQSIVAGNCRIRIYGNDNRVLIGENCTLQDCSIYITGNNNLIKVENRISAVFVAFHMETERNEINIGEGTTIHGRSGGITEFVVDEGTSITVKKDCMISNDISFRTTDSHSVIDSNGERTNPAKNIVIGSHVWIGMRSLVFKNTIIHDNSIVGAGSFCNKDYKFENSLIAGNPAKTVKENVNWSRDRL